MKKFKKIISFLLAIVMTFSVGFIVSAANNTFDDALPVEFSKEYTGEISKSDAWNYYKITLPEAGKLKVDMLAFADVYYDLYGQNKDGVLFNSINISYSPGFRNKTVNVYLTAGVYYFAMHRWDMDGKYNITFDFESANETIPESYGGSNETLNTASEIELNKKYYGVVAKNESFDFYKFTLKEKNKVKIKFHTDASSWVQFYNSKGAEIYGNSYVNNDYGATGNCVLEYELDAGNYYYVVRSTNGIHSTYSLIVECEELSPKYILYYEANGGSGAPSFQYGATTYTVSTTVPVKEGYTFLGWSKDKNALTASYAAGSSITLTENTTLYAVWEVTPVTTYVLSYNANGGYGAPAAQTGATTYTVSSAVPVREGYYFLGWSTDRYATTASYAGGSAIALSGNTTLYAVWKANPTYTCKYCGFVFDDVNAYEAHVKTHEEKPVDVTIEGGTIISGDKTPGSIVTIIAEQIDGKIFKRWIVSGATVTDAYSAETTIIIGEGDVVITADYDECTCGCHQTGIAGFFAKIVIFFQKIFGMNVECLCGMKH